MKNNFLKLFPGNHNSMLRLSLVNKFYSVAYSPTQSMYYRNLKELIDEDKDIVVEFLRGLPVEKWCNVFFRGNRYGEMVNATFFWALCMGKIMGPL